MYPSFSVHWSNTCCVVWLIALGHCTSSALWSEVDGWMDWSARARPPLTWRRGEGDVQVPPPCVLDAGLHLHVFQGVDRVGLPTTGLGRDLYCDLPRRFQSPVGDIKIAKAWWAPWQPSHVIVIVPWRALLGILPEQTLQLVAVLTLCIKRISFLRRYTKIDSSIKVNEQDFILSHLYLHDTLLYCFRRFCDMSILCQKDPFITISSFKISPA